MVVAIQEAYDGDTLVGYTVLGVSNAVEATKITMHRQARHWLNHRETITGAFTIKEHDGANEYRVWIDDKNGKCISPVWVVRGNIKKI